MTEDKAHTNGRLEYSSGPFVCALAEEQYMNAKGVKVCFEEFAVISEVLQSSPGGKMVWRSKFTIAVRFRFTLLASLSSPPKCCGVDFPLLAPRTPLP